MRDTVQHFCEKHLDKIKAYMQKVFVKLPLPIRCGIEGNLFCGLLQHVLWYIFCNLVVIFPKSVTKAQNLKCKFYLCTVYDVNFWYCSSLNHGHSSLMSFLCILSWQRGRTRSMPSFTLPVRGKGSTASIANISSPWKPETQGFGYTSCS